MKQYQYFFLLSAIYLAPHSDITSSIVFGALFIAAAIYAMAKGE